MLLSLKIQDLVLIESLEIPFETGLNIITGETGSGKSALMEALALVLGARADIQMIRHGCNKAFIEAEFDVSSCPYIPEILDKAQIEYELEDVFKIRRELSSNGKSRCFINDQLVPVSLLKEIGKYLVNIVSQHANQLLLESLTHRDFLDTYIGIKKEVQELTKLWDEKQTLLRHIQFLKENAPSRIREKDRSLMEMEELQDANLKPQEEDLLFCEFKKLSKSEELSQKTQEILNFFSEGRAPLLPQLQRHKQQLGHLAAIDPALSETVQAYENVCLELGEILYTLRQYLGNIEHEPSRLDAINERLSIIHRMKKKYGEDWETYQKSLLEKIQELELSDQELKECEDQLISLEKDFSKFSTYISQRRKDAALSFENEVLGHLRSLNMEKAQFKIVLSTISAGPKGIDEVTFYLAPNAGESFFPVQECASGGELARLMLAIKSVIADKEQYPTLVFDEIDANLGGETATIVGEKLHAIGCQRQVLCITHLPQVALKAHYHLKIFKEEKNGRTVTQIQILDPLMRQSEIGRMLGGIITQVTT